MWSEWSAPTRRARLGLLSNPSEVPHLPQNLEFQIPESPSHEPSLAGLSLRAFMQEEIQMPSFPGTSCTETGALLLLLVILLFGRAWVRFYSRMSTSYTLKSTCKQWFPREPSLIGFAQRPVTQHAAGASSIIKIMLPCPSSRSHRII